MGQQVVVQTSVVVERGEQGGVVLRDGGPDDRRHFRACGERRQLPYSFAQSSQITRVGQHALVDQGLHGGVCGDEPEVTAGERLVQPHPDPARGQVGVGRGHGQHVLVE